MKILYLVTQADGGGAQRYVMDLANYFKGIIAAGGEKNDLFAKAEQLGIKTYRLKFLRRNINPILDCLAFFEILKLIKKINPEIVHVNSSKAGILGSIAGKLAGKKIVFTVHGFFYFQNTNHLVTKIYSLIKWFSALFQDKMIAVSEFDRQSALEHKITSSNKITTIHNGISPINFFTKTEAKTRLKLPNEVIIGCIAQYYPRKGLIDLILAFSRLSNDALETSQLILIGDGPQKTELENLISSLNLSGKITLAGYIANAASYLKAFDIFVLPSYQEGFPYVLLEAKLAGLPLIATDVGGNKEILQNNGILVEPGDQTVLTQQLNRLIQDGALRSQLAADKNFTFTIQPMLDKTILIYEQLLK